jgi:hypothetical protein
MSTSKRGGRGYMMVVVEESEGSRWQHSRNPELRERLLLAMHVLRGFGTATRSAIDAEEPCQ